MVLRAGKKRRVAVLSISIAFSPCGKPYDVGKDMTTNSSTEPQVQVSDSTPPEEASGFTAQQLRFLRQLVQGQPQEEAPRTQDPSPGATHGVHVSPMGRAG